MIFFNNVVSSALPDCGSKRKRHKLKAFALAVLLCCVSATAHATSLPQSNMRSTSIMRQNYGRNVYKPQNVNNYNADYSRRSGSSVAPIHVNVGSSKSKYNVHSYGSIGYGNVQVVGSNQVAVKHNDMLIGAKYVNIVRMPVRSSSSYVAAKTDKDATGTPFNGHSAERTAELSSKWGYEAAVNYLDYARSEIIYFGDNALRRFLPSSLEDQFMYWKSDFYAWLESEKGKNALTDGYSDSDLQEWWAQFMFNPGDGSAPDVYSDFVQWLPVGNELWIMLLMAVVYCLINKLRRYETKNMHI